MANKILIVDDDPNQHRIIQYFFEKKGYQIYSAFSGQEGLQKVLDISPALILLDFMMPGMNGESFLKKFWHEARYEKIKNTPIVMLTAAGHEKLFVEKLLDKGLAAYLQKPFGEHELLNVVENVLVNHPKFVCNKQDLAHLRESLDIMESILKNFPGILFTATLEGKFTYFSEGGGQMIHWQPAEVLGKTMFDIFDIASADFANFIRQLKATQEAIHLEALLHDKGDRTVPVELSLSLYRDKNGDLAGVLGVVKDLTAVKKLEEERLQRERVTAIAQAIATVSHQINNPLTPILGNVEILLAYEESLSESVKTKLENIRDSAKRIGQCVQKMQNLSQPIFKEYYKGEMMIDLEKSK